MSIFKVVVHFTKIWACLIFRYTNKGSSTPRDVISADTCGQIGARQTCHVLELHVVKPVLDSPSSSISAIYSSRESHTLNADVLHLN